MQTKKHITLTMIVRNEAAVIRRCLRSVRNHIDSWVIADTGSTDGTQEIIYEELSGIPGILLERPWVDFSTNRNEAIEDAEQRFRPDYCLTLDADEELVPSAGFSLKNLSADTYSALFVVAGTPVKWARKLLFRPHLRYRFVLDEVLEDGATAGMLQACEVLSHSDGARNADGLTEKFKRDVEVLRAAVEREPESPRYWFYLAQRLWGSGNPAEALVAYQKRISLGGFPEERDYSQFMVGQCHDALGHGFDVTRDAYLAAWQQRPTRAEPLYALGCLYCNEGQYALAELYARAAQRIPRPQEALIVDESVYAWRAADLLAGTLAEQGKLTESKDILQKLIALPQTPSEEHERIQANIDDLTAAITEEKIQEAPTNLGPDEVTYRGQAARVRKGGLGEFRKMAVEYLGSYLAQSLPSPTRWLWILMVAGWQRWGYVSALALAVLTGALAHSVDPAASVTAAALAAASPLLWHVGVRRPLFQDAPVAAATLAAMLGAAHGNALAVGVAVLVMLALKEAAVFCLPAVAVAWWFSGADWLGFGAAVTAGVATNALVLAALFGGTLLPMLRAGSRGHRTPYTLENQVGAPHRLLVDLVLLSPVTTMLGAFAHPWLAAMAAALVAVHALAPVRNVRLVLAADMALRAAAAVTYGWYLLPAILFDVYVTRKLRHVYDPVTAALTSQLGMSK